MLIARNLEKGRLSTISGQVTRWGYVHTLLANKRVWRRSPGQAYVEGDASSASYFLAGAAVTGGTVTVEGCGTSSLQVSPQNFSRCLLIT